MWPFNRKGPSGFSSSSTAEDVTQGVDGTGLTAIVTGASSGIGTETTRVLALRGVHVIMGVRNMVAGKDAKEAIVKEIPTAKVDAMELDLSSMASVKKFASNFNSSGLPLNILINNAGVMATPFMLSKDNIELQFATNHLGHFLLTNLLLENMKKTSRKSRKEGRIVNVSSEAHRFSYREGIRFDKLNDKSGYSSFAAYGQSKLSNVLHANELARTIKYDGVEITANSLHPGAIATNLFRQSNIMNGIVNSLGRFVLKNVQQGAATTCYVALHPQVKGVSGEYFSDSNLSKASTQGERMGGPGIVYLDVNGKFLAGWKRRKGPSGFSASTTAEEVTEGIDGTGLTAIVTGGSSGVGTETARVLALRGVHVAMGVRNMTAGREVKEAMVKGNPTTKIDAMELDLSSMASENEAEITANSVHPGAVATDLFHHQSFVSGLIGLLGKYMIKNVQQGAATTCYVALHPQVKGVSGHYFADSNKVEASPQANYSELAKKLWNFSLNMIDRCTPVS
nr:short-chain dehydrogenase tic 32, chloroplastic [Quercus suber]